MVNAFALLIALGALGAVLAACRRPRELWDLDEGEGLLGRLARRRARVLRALKDLEVERDAGTLSEDEFRSLRREYKRRAIAVSKDLERARQARLRALSKARGELSASQRRAIDRKVLERQERKETA